LIYKLEQVEASCKFYSFNQATCT